MTDCGTGLFAAREKFGGKEGKYRLLFAAAKVLCLDERLKVAKGLIDERITRWTEGSRAEILTLISGAFYVDKTNSAPWGGTPARRAKIEVMWRAYAGCKDERALRTFIKRIAKGDHPRFLNTLLARKVIIAPERIDTRSQNLGAIMTFIKVTNRRLSEHEGELKARIDP